MDDKLSKQIKEAYQTGRSSIQTIARVHRVDVDDVLHVIGEHAIAQVHMPGDLIDASEAGPNASMNHGKTEKVNFSTN